MNLYDLLARKINKRLQAINFQPVNSTLDEALKSMDKTFAELQKLSSEDECTRNEKN